MATSLAEVQTHIYAGSALIYFAPESVEIADVHNVTREELDACIDVTDEVGEVIGWEIDGDKIIDAAWGRYSSNRMGMKVTGDTKLLCWGDKLGNDVRKIWKRGTKGWILLLLNGEISPDNLVTNSGFEADTSGWLTENADSLTRSTAEAYAGVASGFVQPTGTPAVDVIAGLTPAASPTVLEGETYHASARVLFPTGFANVNVALSWLDGVDAEISETDGVVSAATAGEWTRYFVSGVAPAGAVKCSPRVKVEAPTATDDFFVDQMYFSDPEGDGVPMDVYPVTVIGRPKPVTIDGPAALLVNFAVTSEPAEDVIVPIL